MTMKQDVLNELNMCDGVTRGELLMLMNIPTTSLDPCLSDIKKKGLIETVGKRYYLTDTGKAEVVPVVPDKPTKPPKMPNNQSAIPPKNEHKKIVEKSPISDQFDKLKQQLTPISSPDNLKLKIDTCERLAELLADDIGDLLLEISADYKAYLA